MFFYRLKMTWTDNGENTLPPDKLKEFISATSLIGIGCPTTKGYKLFIQPVLHGVRVFGKKTEHGTITGAAGALFDTEARSKQTTKQLTIRTLQ